MPTRRYSRGISFEGVLLLIFLCIAASIGTLRFIEYLDKSKRYDAVGAMAEIQAGLELYKHDNGVYPDSIKETEIYLRHEVGMDPWGNFYLYKTDKTSYTLTSFAADGKEGGDELDADMRVSNK